MIDFYILGNPRSGTTLLRLMLTTNDEINIPPEAGFSVWLYENTNLNENFTIDNFLVELKKTKKIDNYDICFNELRDFMYQNNVVDLISAFSLVYKFNTIKQGKHNALIGDKNNFFINHLDTLNNISPNAKYIHIIRDGRDVACSYRELMNKKIESIHAPILSQDISEIAKEWSENILSIKEFTDTKNSIVVRLEDLIEYPVLNVKFDAKMLEFYKNKKDYEPKEYEQWKQKNKLPIINDNYKFKKLLRKNEIMTFQNIAKSELLNYGYEIYQ